ncbi:hypothetical protein QAD02_012792 [Eretmocerus hayati]|uniref:Uncharacterized protein n=1 Tax=Eretmocerus hayati TaxID=131215 RepID=A0ACC2P0E1_9HYME|nr:hypothetical protein QAD02_012792 [Eretmocerus hayati]
MDVSQDVVLNPNEQFDASDIVQADSSDSVEGTECYSRIISETDDRSSVMDIDSTSVLGSQDMNVSQDRVLNQQFDASDIVQAYSGDSVEVLECYSRVISESDDRSSVMDINSTSESGSLNVNVSRDRVLNPNEQFHMSDIVQADTDDSVEPLGGYLRIISESDDRSSVMDIDDASEVSSIAEEKSSFETNSKPKSDDRSSVMDINSTSESGSLDVNVSQDRVLNPNEQFRMSDIVQADTDDSVEPLGGYSRIISESDDRSSVMDIDDASGVSSIAEEKSSFETNSETNNGGIESEYIIPKTQSDACPPDSLPHPTQDDEGCRCEESSSTGDISTPEGLVHNTQNSVKSLVLQLDSFDAVLSDDSVRTGEWCCVNDSGESCGHKRRRTLSERSVMDEQMGAPAVDKAMEQLSKSENSQHAGAHPGVIDPPQLESDGDQGEDFNISGE